jgi:hypothetical protein
MGTFHQDRGEYHGITIVVDTKGPRVYVGRCHDEDGQALLLADVDVHEEGQGGESKEQFIQRTARLGVWKKYDRLSVPKSEIASIRRLGDIPKS